MTDATPATTGSVPGTTPPVDGDPLDHETRVAWWCALAVLGTLTVVKPISGVAFLGTIAVTFAALLQLYLPLWRAGKLDRDNDWVGLHFQTWRRDLKLVLILAAITFPPFIVGHHLYMSYAHDWMTSVGLEELARFVPRRALHLTWPSNLPSFLAAAWWLVQIVATHTLGVALPEETFYRGYLQPQLERKWTPRHTVFGVPFGRAAVVACALFALGHFLGEWNPMRLGPFFPGLLFAWLRNSSGSVVGAISYHAACNVLGEVLFSMYGPT